MSIYFLGNLDFTTKLLNLLTFPMTQFKKLQKDVLTYKNFVRKNPILALFDKVRRTSWEVRRTFYSCTTIYRGEVEMGPMWFSK